MNKFSRMLMQDGRNPYGSRGGYVRSDRRNDYEDDYAMRGNRDRNDYGYDMVRRDRNMDYAIYNENRMRDRDYEDDYRRDRNEDYRRRDYGKPEMFSHKDMETWKSMMKNEDGTRGEHFRKEQVKHACQQAGIDCEEFGEDVFGLAINMMYSDYCKVAKKYGVDMPEYYADMAKAFLRDKDFDGKPEEKLYLYYKAIVERDD
jgi:hypothetical protein